MSDWKTRFGQTARDAATSIQQGVQRVGSEVAAAHPLTTLAWPPSVTGLSAVVAVPLTSLATEDGAESQIWRAAGIDGRGNWQFEIHNGKPAILASLASTMQGIVDALASRHTWQWPVAGVGEGAVVCQDEGRTLQAVCYAWKATSVMWATAWVPGSPPDPREPAAALVRAVYG